MLASARIYGSVCLCVCERETEKERKKESKCERARERCQVQFPLPVVQLIILYSVQVKRECWNIILAITRPVHSTVMNQRLRACSCSNRKRTKWRFGQWTMSVKGEGRENSNFICNALCTVLPAHKQSIILKLIAKLQKRQASEEYN